MQILSLKKIFLKKNNIKYNIDHILPTKIIGWISSKDYDFDEIIISSKEKIISKSKINIERNDVSEKLGVNSNVGFILDLPYNKPSFNLEKIKITAYGKDKNNKFNLKINQKEKFHKTSSKLIHILSSKILGLDGHFNGKDHSNDNLHGWISTYSKEAPTIWLNFKNNTPIAVRCSERYYKKDSFNKYYYYYSFYIEDIPINYSGEVWFSFDKEGIYIANI